MNTITGGNGPSCSGCVTNVGIRPALVGISTMRSFISLYLVPSRSMLELAEQHSARGGSRHTTPPSIALGPAWARRAADKVNRCLAYLDFPFVDSRCARPTGPHNERDR